MLCSTGTLAAQQHRVARVHAVELTLAAGVFVPTGVDQAGSFRRERRLSWEAGAHFGAYAKRGWWGAEVSAGYAPERASAGPGLGSYRTHITYGTVRALLGRSPRRRGISYMAGAGFSVLHRQKSVASGSVPSTHAGGALSLFVRIPIDDQVGLRLDGEHLLYRADFGAGRKWRNDFVLSAGLGISW